MTFGGHGRQTPDLGIHVAVSWTFADETARNNFTPTSGIPTTAGELVADDIGKMAWQLDTNVIYILISIGPPTWSSIGQAELHAATHLPGEIDALSTDVPVQVGVGNSEGVATSFSRSDHLHKRVMNSLDIEGLIMSVPSAFQAQIDVGRCRSDDDTLDIVASSTLTADITASGANGLDTGAEAASTWYSLWVIADSTATNPVASLLSVSSTSPTMPTGYDKKRRVGWVRNDASSDFLSVIYVSGNHTRRYRYYEDRATGQVLNNGSAIVYTDVDCSAFVPPTSTWFECFVSLDDNVGFAAGHIIRNGGTQFVNSPLSMFSQAGVSSVYMWVETDNSQLVEYKVNNAANLFTIEIVGYLDVL